jgi:uncharacterized iron-regulated membrane protein
MFSSWKRPANWMRWHRYLGYLIGIQLILWVLGGVIFSIVPFQTWVKGTHLVTKPKQDWSNNWQQSLTDLPQNLGALLDMRIFVSAHGPTLRLQYEQEEIFRLVNGKSWQTPEQTQITHFAKQIYQGTGPLVKVERLAQAPTNLGIVKEIGDRKDIWRAEFADDSSTRLYFDGRSGEYLTIRTDAWVWYDFFWRLHTMDYSEGEDFNNTLLRIAAILAFLMITTGTVLSIRNLIRKRL